MSQKSFSIVWWISLTMVAVCGFAMDRTEHYKWIPFTIALLVTSILVYIRFREINRYYNSLEQETVNSADDNKNAQ